MIGFDDSGPMAIFIMGPTASGKTTLALELADKLPCEIVSVDSAQVYRGMDIGTAKPDAATLLRVPHHLIDICDPVQAYSAAQFCTDAWQQITAIHSRGRIPVLSGGTMLYFRALERGLTELPTANPQLRARLDEERAHLGLTALYDRLARIDPVAASRIHPHDPQRIQRALEVYELTGHPITELYRRQRNETKQLRLLKLALIPNDRILLHRHIAKRFAQMLNQGFVEEVCRLRTRNDLHLDKPALRAVGYRQIWQYLEGNTDYATMVERCIAATRQLAKRQLTWLRSESNIKQLDGFAPGLIQQATDCFKEFCDQ